ncbi:MAG: M1 family aminopeptidase [Gemmatimonadota bacterium]
MNRCGSMLLLGASLLTACAEGRQASPEWVAPGISRELADLRHRTLSDVRYDLRLSVPAERASPLTGRIEVSFRWSGTEGEPLILDFTEPSQRVRSVELDGVPVVPELVADHIRIPGDGLRTGETHRVAVTFVAGDGSLNRNDDFLYTLFVPDRAHFALPLFDQPNLKARLSLELEIPSGWQAVANGSEMERRDDETRSTLRFSETAPISTYLFAFAVGRFQVESQSRAGRTMRMFHRETDAAKVKNNADSIFALHERALLALEKYTDIPYPFEKYDFVAVPAFQYGGMEHPGAVFYRADGLLLDEVPTQGQLLGRASVISHETAHMWFGDLVTMDWFDDVWLKEVFANFMAAKIVEPSFPQVDHALRFVLAHHPAAYAVDRTPGANPILQPLENLNQAGTLYGPIIYQKAPIVMKHLERRMGDESFKQGLRTYLDRFRFSNARWSDLIGILDERTDEDLVGWSHVWVEEPGRPTVAVERSGTSLDLSQSDPAGKGRVWPQILDVWAGARDGGRMLQVPLDGPEARVEVGESVEYVLPMASGIPYGLFRLDDRSLEVLLAQVFTLPDPVLRGTAWLTIWDAALEGWVERDRLLDLLVQGIAAEQNELIFARLANDLSEAFWRFLPPAERSRWASRVEGALTSRIRSGDPATLRATALRTFVTVATTTEGVEFLRGLWSGAREVPGVPVSENDRTRIALQLAVREVEGWPALLDAEAGRITNPDRQQRFAFVRDALSDDPEARDSFFSSLAQPSRREHEPWVLEALGYLNHPLRQENALGYITPALDLLEEVQRTGDIFFPGGWVNAVLDGHNTQEAAEAVQRFLAAHPAYPPRLRNKILQALDPLERAVRLSRTSASVPVADGA